MPRTTVCLMLTCALWVAAGWFGCASNETAYRYDAIRTEYAGPACNVEKPRVFDASTTPCSVSGRLTLPDVLAIARANNPDLLMAAARIERARAMLEKSTAPFYPQVSVYSEYLQGDAPSAYLFKSIDQRKLPPNTDFNDPGWFENFESGVKAGINLYNGGRDRLNRNMAETGLTISRLNRDGIENRIMATAIGAYYDVLAAANFTAVAQESVETTRSQLRIMKVRFQSGGALKTDLLSLQVRVAETEEILLQSRNRQRLAQAALTEILGLEPDAPVGDLDEQAYGIDIPDTPAAALEFALTHRPDLSSVRERLRRSKMALDAARAGYLPQIDFMTRYYADDPDMKYSTDRDNWTAGLYLNWTLFDGFATRGNRAEALSQLQETLAADRKALLAVKFDVKKAYLNLNEADERLKVAASSVKTARETHGLVKHQYEGGAADITRYLEAELAYSRARMRETSAYFDREKARAQVARAIGFWTDGQRSSPADASSGNG